MNKGIGLFYLFGIVVLISFWAAVIYVAHHFIARYW